MATITGSEVLAQSLRSQGVDTLFSRRGGPMLETEAACIQLGIRAIDTRHEQAAALAAHAWTRVTRRPGVCMGCSGPGTTNLVTGGANPPRPRPPRPAGRHARREGGGGERRPAAGVAPGAAHARRPGRGARGPRAARARRAPGD